MAVDPTTSVRVQRSRLVAEGHGLFPAAANGEDIRENRDGHLGAAGIEHSEVADLADVGLAILSFQDPVDINVELTAPLG